MLGDALVAEVPADLVDLLEPADDEPLQVELERDPQVEVAIQGVVVGDERPRGGPAESGWSTGVSTSMKPSPSRKRRMAGSPGARDEHLAHLRVGDQVQVALTVAGLDVRQPVVLLGQRPQRLGQQREVLDRGASARPAATERTPSTPIRSPRSNPSSRSIPSAPSSSTRAWSWIRPERSTRSRNAILPWPRRAARRPATRWRTSVSSPAARPACAARTAAIGSTPVELVRERVDPGGAERLELAPTRRQQLSPSRRLARSRGSPYFDSTSILVILRRRSPLGS